MMRADPRVRLQNDQSRDCGSSAEALRRSGGKRRIFHLTEVVWATVLVTEMTAGYAVVKPQFEVGRERWARAG